MNHPLEQPITTAPTEQHEVDICVVGGGMAGLCAAIAAARNGARVALLQDRAVLGGNASSEVRMWICGAHGRDYAEAGILEEIKLENLYRNPDRNYPLWDTVLYEKAAYQDGLQLHLSCAVCEVQMDGDRIASVRAWHLTRQCWLEVAAKQFIDCSGDSILRLSGAPTRWGHESCHEFDEPAAPEFPDRQTMGNSILIQLREIDPADHRPFIAPEWANTYDDSHPRLKNAKPVGHNFWWLEIGGEQDTCDDADEIRDELYRIAFGAWAFIKNHPDGRGHSWELEWIGALPGKRENIRYVGAHTMCQREIEECGKYADIIGHGGWAMDDHPPAAFNNQGEGTTFYPTPSPYGIPYRSLFSLAVPNLSFAGRNISATHIAMSSTRVMATCAVMGQAIGTATALCIKHQCDHQQVHAEHLGELQSQLQDDDQWLPGRERHPGPLTRAASLAQDALRDGQDRRLGDDWHAWEGQAGNSVELRWDETVELPRLRLVGDSQLHRNKRMPCSYPKRGNYSEMPETLPRTIAISAEINGQWQELHRIENNRLRLITCPLVCRATALRITVERSWAEDGSFRLFSIDVDPVSTETPASCAWPEVRIGGVSRVSA